MLKSRGLNTVTRGTPLLNSAQPLKLFFYHCPLPSIRQVIIYQLQRVSIKTISMKFSNQEFVV